MTADRVNLAALLAALVLAAGGALVQPEEDAPRGAVVTVEPAAAGAAEVIDGRGVAVPVAPYRRIVSLHVVADHLLLDLVEPGRLVGVTDGSKLQHPDGWRFGDIAGLARPHSLETLLALRPDLVIVSNFVDEAALSRLRDRGVAVFDLGEMRGVRSTVDDIRALGVLLGVSDRAARLEDRYLRELAALDRAVPDQEMAPGLYLSVYGDAFFGGTEGTSYADLLRTAGVADIAAAHGFVDWPRFTPEQLVALDPALVVTQEGMAGAICGHTVLREIAACGEGGRIVELPGRYHTDPGLGIVPAAQIVQRLVHPDARASFTP